MSKRDDEPIRSVIRLRRPEPDEGTALASFIGACNACPERRCLHLDATRKAT